MLTLYVRKLFQHVYIRIQNEKSILFVLPILVVRSGKVDVLIVFFLSTAMVKSSVFMDESQNFTVENGTNKTCCIPQPPYQNYQLGEIWYRI